MQAYRYQLKGNSVMFHMEGLLHRLGICSHEIWEMVVTSCIIYKLQGTT